MCIIGQRGNPFISFADGVEPPVPTIGGWIELGRTTLGSPGDTITVSGLADKRYYMVLWSGLPSGILDDINLTLGNSTIDTASNYAARLNNSGGTDETFANQTSILIDKNSGPFDRFGHFYISNLSGKEKLVQGGRIHLNNFGAGNAPLRIESVGKWTNTSNPLDILRLTNIGSGDFATGSEVVVLGWDPIDTHITNFWEVLADVDLSDGESDTISSGTIIAKKYLWVQCFLESSGTVQDGLRVGNGSVDTGSNYSYRFSTNGGADSTAVNQNDIGDFSNISNNQFGNLFIINNTNNEKLITYHINEGKTGAGSAPTRLEVAAKWDNTANQINIIEMRNVAGSGNYGKTTFIKVWGSD